MKIDEISGDDFRKLLDVNLVSYFLVAKVSDLITTLSHKHSNRAILNYKYAFKTSLSNFC